MSQLLQGTVKWFNNAKGFGFVEHSTGQDVFVHYSVIQTDGFKTLKDGEEVKYELAEGTKGLHAAKVFRLKDLAANAEADQSTSLEIEVSKDTASSSNSTTQSSESSDQSAEESL